MKTTAENSARWNVGGRVVAVSNLQKPLYPSGFTKRQVLDYYRAVAPVMLPYLEGRAVTLKRFPNGSDQPYFFEKNCPNHRPQWVSTAKVKGKSGSVQHCVLKNTADLLWAANLAALELHVPLAKASHPDRPTVIAFDLDPGPPADIRLCAAIALRLRKILAGLGLECVAKTSGGKGLHVYLPLNIPGVSFDDTRQFAKLVAQLFQKDDPEQVTAKMTRSLRAGKVFVDWSQNDPHKTTACAYTLRANQTPGVSTPLTWDEVALAERGKMKLQFKPEQVIERVERLGDLFVPVQRLRQRLQIETRTHQGITGSKPPEEILDWQP
jgi:bifunctional non-homologous end joining protein LigD